MAQSLSVQLAEEIAAETKEVDDGASAGAESKEPRSQGAEPKDGNVPLGESAEKGTGGKEAPGAEKAPEGSKETEPVKPDAPATPPRSFKVKVDGEEREVSEEDLVKNYQLASTSYARIQKATELQKGAQFVLQEAAKDPRGVVLQILGRDLKSEDKALDRWRALCVSEVKSMLEEEGMDEGARAVRQRERELERKERDINAKEEEARGQVEARLTQEAETRLESEIGSAITTEKLPNTPPIVRRIAQYLSFAAENSLDMTAHEAAILVKRDYETARKELAGVPPVNAGELAQAKTAASQTKDKNPSTAFPSTGNDSGERKGPAADRQRARSNSHGKFKTPNEFHRQIQEAIGTG